MKSLHRFRSPRARLDVFEDRFAWESSVVRWALAGALPRAELLAFDARTFLVPHLRRCLAMLQAIEEHPMPSPVARACAVWARWDRYELVSSADFRDAMYPVERARPWTRLATLGALLALELGQRQAELELETLLTIRGAFGWPARIEPKGALDLERYLGPRPAHA